MVLLRPGRQACNGDVADPEALMVADSVSEHAAEGSFPRPEILVRSYLVGKPCFQCHCPLPAHWDDTRPDGCPASVESEVAFRSLRCVSASADQSHQKVQMGELIRLAAMRETSCRPVPPNSLQNAQCSAARCWADSRVRGGRRAGTLNSASPTGAGRLAGLLADIPFILEWHVPA